MRLCLLKPLRMAVLWKDFREGRPTGCWHKRCWGQQRWILEKGLHPGALKDMVTSPGGTTIEGCLALEKGGMRAAVMECVVAGAEKSKKM